MVLDDDVPNPANCLLLLALGRVAFGGCFAALAAFNLLGTFMCWLRRLLFFLRLFFDFFLLKIII